MESEVQYGMITKPLIKSWKDSLNIVGHAVCVHHQCRLCFLSIQGMISHHKSCPGWTDPGDFIPCTHCGARFKQFRSIQTHVERCHNNQFSASTSQSSDSWASPPPLPLTPDIVPRPAPTSPSSPAPVSQGRRLSSNTSVREDVLAEREVQMSELESLVRETEIKAQEAMKKMELSKWERDQQEKFIELNRRMMEAQKILNETSGGAGPSSPFIPAQSFISSDSVRSSSISGASPPAEDSSGLPSYHSTPNHRQTINVLSPRQIFGPPRPPIVLPSSAKLPASAIRLTPSNLPLFQNNINSSSSISQTSSEDSPINLSKPRHDLSIDEESTISQPESVSSDINTVQSLARDVPRVEVTQATSIEIPLKVVADSESVSIQPGDSGEIYYPVTDPSCPILLQDDKILQDFLQTAEVVTFVAEDGPNGQITLVPQEDFREAEADQISAEFDQVKRNMAEISFPEGQVNEDEQTAYTEASSEVLNYFEKRVMDFETEINQSDTTLLVTEDQVCSEEPARNCVQPEPEPVTPKVQKRKLEDSDTTDSLSISKRRRSSRFNGNDNEQREESDDIEITVNAPTKKTSKKEDSTFSCGRCKSVLQSERSWRRHRDSVHGGSARLIDHPDGQEFDSDQEEQSWKAALASCKKISCPRCNKVSFTKQTILLDHLKTCGKCQPSQPPPPPPPASTPSKPPPPPASTPSKKQETVKEPPSGRSKRQAATKARSTVAEFVKAMKTRYDGDTSGEEHEIEANMEDSDDNFNIGSEVNVLSFYKQVKVGKRTNFVCNVCNKNYKKKEDVENHIVSEHKDKLSEGEDDDIEDSEGESTDTDVIEDEDDDVLECGVGKQKRRKHESSSVQRRLIIEPNVEGVKLEKSYRESCYGKFKLSDLGLSSSLRNDWKTVKKVPLPSSSEYSPSFHVRSMFSSSDKGKVRSMRRFSGEFSQNKWMLYTGGPVVSMAWSSRDSEEENQVLAVVSRKDFSPSPLLEPYSGPGLIQFWSVPAAGQPPVFLFGLSHQYGDLTSLEWSPSKPKGELGLLAGGCTDGSVRLWRVPELGRRQGEIYTCQPHLSLHWGEEAGQCLSTSWYRGPGHHYLAGCSSQGLVSVWHLASQSPLLRQDSDLLPVQTWLAHTGSASSVSFCPGSDQEPRYVVTGGSDRCYKFWDLRDTSVPIQEVKRGLVSGVDWIPGWCGAAVSYDDVYLQGHTQTMLAEAGYYSSKSHPVISQNSAVTCLGVSQWLGCMAVCTAAGELILFVVPSLERSLEHDKNLAQRRVYVYRTEVTASKSLPDSEAREFEAVKAARSVNYIDSCLSKAGKQPVCPPEEVRRVRLKTDTEDLTQFPLAGLTSLAWNNNPGHQTLLASGGHAGLVRVHRLDGLRSPPLQNLL